MQDHLFASLIPTAVAGLPRQRTGRRYTEDQVHGWLHHLARYLETRREQPRGGTDIALHELWEMAGNRTTRSLHCAVVCLVFGLAFGLVEGLAGGRAGGLVVGLVGGLAGGLAVGLPRSTTPKRLGWRTRRKGGLRRRLLAGLTVGLPFGVVVGLVVGFTTWLATVLDRLADGVVVHLVSELGGVYVVGFIIGLPLGLAIGLVAHDEPALSERRSIHDDALAGLTVGLAVALMVWLAAWLALGLAGGLAGGLQAALALVLVLGLPLGLAFAAATARYACAMLLFAFRRTFPARPALFLDWAQHAGLLRVTGAAYQYRHETYRRWLLEQPKPLP